MLPEVPAFPSTLALNVVPFKVSHAPPSPPDKPALIPLPPPVA